MEKEGEFNMQNMRQRKETKELKDGAILGI